MAIGSGSKSSWGMLAVGFVLGALLISVGLPETEWGGDGGGCGRTEIDTSTTDESTDNVGTETADLTKGKSGSSGKDEYIVLKPIVGTLVVLRDVKGVISFGHGGGKNPCDQGSAEAGRIRGESYPCCEKKKTGSSTVCVSYQKCSNDLVRCVDQITGEGKDIHTGNYDCTACPERKYPPTGAPEIEMD